MSIDEKLDELLWRTKSRDRNLSCDLTWIMEVANNALHNGGGDEAMRAIVGRCRDALLETQEER
jgi:hypothetical protein